MTRVRIGNEPEKVVDIPDTEIEDLRRLGATVEVVKEEQPDQAAKPKGK